MSNVVHVGPAKAQKSDVSLGFELFPDSLHACLREIDDEGNGQLELDELTEIFTKYADMKRAQKVGAIAISSFGDDVQKTLKLFDSSGDGLIEPSELQRAAELYADSKLMVGRLIKLSVVLLLFMGALLGCIAGLTIAVVEGAKEQKTSKSGITTVKGDENTPVAYGKVTNETTLKDAVDMSAEELKKITSLTLPITGKKTLGYTVTGYTKITGDYVKFYTARGDTVTVDNNKEILIESKVMEDGTETLKTLYDSSKARRRRRSRRRNLLADGRTLLALEYDSEDNSGWSNDTDTDTSTDTSIDIFSFDDGVDSYSATFYDLDSDEQAKCRCYFIKEMRRNIINTRRRLLDHDDSDEPDDFDVDDIDRLLNDNDCVSEDYECGFGCEQLFGEWAPMCSFIDSDSDSDNFGAMGDVGTSMPKPDKGKPM